MKSILNISEATLLALHSISLIAKNKMINTKEIAEKINASENHLAKVLQRLVKSGFIKSTRGPSGGFKLSKNESDISLLDIFESMEGKVNKNLCLIQNNSCPFKECILGDLNNKFTQEFINTLRNKKLNEII